MCTIRGAVDEFCVFGYCKIHYLELKEPQLRDQLLELHIIDLEKTPRGEWTCYWDCGRPYYRGGFCRPHYDQHKQQNPNWSLRRPKLVQETCAISECESPVKGA